MISTHDIQICSFRSHPLRSKDYYSVLMFSVNIRDCVRCTKVLEKKTMSNNELTKRCYKILIVFLCLKSKRICNLNFNILK